MWCKVRVQLHSFAYGYLGFLSTIFEKTVSSPLNGTLINNHLTISVRVYFWALYFIPLVYMSVFIKISHCFDNCSFVVSFFKLIFIEVQLLYNIVIVSTVQQSELAIRIHIPPLFWISFPFRSPQSIEQSSLCYTVASHQLCILYIVSKVYICQSQSPNSSHPPFPLGIHTFVLYACVFTSALQIISSIPFFQIPHICVNI